jgi:predicted Rossmann fold nucleotide-binding protein DprA/Smf involved in DNA uptake
VVSGLAAGIDTVAHTAVVERQGVTWATLPGGLDVIYPPSNRRLAARIVETGGALISEYLPGTRPLPRFFVERDRLQAALADLVVVVETEPRGGTMHTVRVARSLRVPIRVAFPDDAAVVSETGPGALPEVERGTWALLQDGEPRLERETFAELLNTMGEGGTGTRKGKRLAPGATE